MPKRVFDLFLQSLERDIRTSYKVGDRYRTVREIAAQFEVSLQTAQKAVSVLADQGILEAKQRSCISITSLNIKTRLRGKRILFFSNNVDPRFNSAFLEGIRCKADPKGVKVDLAINTIEETDNLAFGEHVVNLVKTHQAAAMIAVNFLDQALPFYHVMSRGVDVIADVVLDKLPSLAVVQTDNVQYSREAAKRLHSYGKTDILVAGYWEKDNTRFQAFRDEFLSRNPNATLRYACLAESNSIGHLHLFFESFDKTKAVFSADHAANWIIAPYFKRRRIPVEQNFLVYGAERERFLFPGLKPVEATMPGLVDLGGKLAAKLFAKLETGKWPQPLVEKV